MWVFLSLSSVVIISSCLSPDVLQLVILAPEHVALISDLKAATVSLDRDSHGSTHASDADTARRGDSVIVQALMSAFASCPTLSCIHPVRIQEAVLIALLSLLNHRDTARFFPITQIAVSSFDYPFSVHICLFILSFFYRINKKVTGVTVSLISTSM